MRAVLIGFGLGFVVAVQLGPLSLFLIRTTLRSGLVAGLAVGAGIACIDGLYAALGAAGAAPLLGVEPLRLAMGVLGALVLAWLGLRSLHTAWRVRAGQEIAADAMTPRRAFGTSLGATASNPLTIVSWAAVFAAAGVATDEPAPPLVLGVALGSAVCVSTLALVSAAVRRVAGPRAVRTADTLAGVGMLAFAGILGHRTLQQAG